ncbi:Membrane dipeptidase (Peptidase family M19) [Planctomycetes bacterium Pan216]|uniref:Membrane dipeptidase (Peptidase family M19) n=1 Tax=Kolteria novifilia TaxID=2527975 RepID=A0A518B7D9_9BACT|nr:Membrane dipeptidase (Peptidase family M19) [Planctomycetes bacterium Pan216]
MQTSAKPLVRRRSFLQASAVGTFGTLLGQSARGANSREVWQTGNETIDEPRRIGIDLLKPTKAQLERAWELHSGSLVFESYGFSPRQAIDGTWFQEAADEGAYDEELTDIREGSMMNRAATDQREREEFLHAFRAAGVDCVFQNAGEEGNDPMRLLKRLAHFTYLTDRLKPTLSKAVTARQVRETFQAGQISLCFTGNGVPLRQRWRDVRDELGLVRLFHELGILMMHLTYNRRNPLGDGCGEPNDAGLSDFGHAGVAEMNEVGVIVDVAHSGWKTSLDAAKASTKPLVASHTTCAGLYEHFRSKPDNVIKAICDTGGYVGICAISRFLGGKGDLVRFLDHVDYVVKKFGPDHCAIGTDVAYTSRHGKAESTKIKRRPGGRSGLALRRNLWEHLWPEDKYSNSAADRQSLAWTNWPLFTLGMVMRGYSDETIQKILGGNVLRVLEANVSARRTTAPR